MSPTPSHRAMAGTWAWRRVRFLLPAAYLCQALGLGQMSPQPPCGSEPVPPYPSLDDTAIVKFWSKPDLGRNWQPPSCTGWTTEGFATLVTTAARFRHSSEAEGLLRHIGAISELAGMRYWSTTHQQWRTLIVDKPVICTGLPPSLVKVEVERCGRLRPELAVVFPRAS